MKMVANIKDRNTAVYVGSSLDLLFSVHKLRLNELMRHFNWSIRLAFQQARKRKESLQLQCTSLEFQFHLKFPCGLLLTELSDFCQSERNENESECKQTLKNTSQG